MALNCWNYLDTMQKLAGMGEVSYRELTDNTPGLMDYFYEATPVQEISQLNIGSRPSHRKQTVRDKSSIRAIPWVFGWGQARHTLPAWYGIGTALTNFQEKNANGLALLQEMYQNWPAFNALLDNTQMALFKADMQIAHEYAALMPDQEIANAVYQHIFQEYQRTKAAVLKISGQDKLLEENPLLHYSLRRREPYLDPLNHVQVTLIKRHRTSLLTEDKNGFSPWLDVLLRTINAIAAGMRNTG